MAGFFPLKPFAKLFETSRGQLLFHVGEDDQGEPALLITCVGSNNIEVTTALTSNAPLEADEERYEAIHAALDRATLEMAENYLAEMFTRNEGSTND